jgi:hypothetical protein
LIACTLAGARAAASGNPQGGMEIAVAYQARYKVFNSIGKHFSPLSSDLFGWNNSIADTVF